MLEVLSAKEQCRVPVFWRQNWVAWESESGSQFEIGRTGLDRVGLTEKVMLEQGFELGEGVSHI